jgi:hypothetical protein
MSVAKMIIALPFGFQGVAMDGQLSIHVMSVLEKTVRWTKCIDRGSDKSPPYYDQGFLVEFDPRANSSLLIQWCRISSEGRNLERALCKALFVYHANILNWTCRCAGYKRIMGELLEAVRTCNPQEFWEIDFWLWMCLLAANGARRGALQQVQAEFMDNFLRLNRQKYTWVSIQGLFTGFLLHSSLISEWKLCWDMAQRANVSRVT